MEIELNQELINRCNNQSMYDRGNHIQDDARSDYRKFVEHYSNMKLNEKQLEILETRKYQFRQLLSSCYNDYLSTSAKFVPVNVAVPSNYPSAKMERVMESTNKKFKDMEYKINKFYKNTDNMLKSAYTKDEILNKYRNGYSEPISTDDPIAKEKLEAKLEYLEKKHQQDIEYNKNARKNGKPQLAPYILANSNQNIKSVKDRLLQLEKMNNLNLLNYRFENGKVCFDKEDNRVKIYFDEKPSEEIRTKLKTHAYKWSPKNLAWQRKLTSDAIYMTRNLFKDIGSLQKVNNCIEHKNISM